MPKKWKAPKAAVAAAHEDDIVRPVVAELTTALGWTKPIAFGQFENRDQDGVAHKIVRVILTQPVPGFASSYSHHEDLSWTLGIVVGASATEADAIGWLREVHQAAPVIAPEQAP